MTRRFRKRTSLTDKEQAEFQQLVDQFRKPPGSGSPDRRRGWTFRLRAAFWRHHLVATLLFPLGLGVMAVGLVTWWPLGLLGGALVVGGLVALGAAATVAVQRRQLRDQVRKP
ncbi:MAG: hypothetical protein OEV40_14380 [Acidimicrobiia bacterium]|nr:hypothetical protein [Acidimicrobiia bacterium]